LNAPSDGSDAIAGCSAFQTFAAATGKARSPMVLCNDRGTCSDGDDADRRRLRESVQNNRAAVQPVVDTAAERLYCPPDHLAVTPSRRRRRGIVLLRSASLMLLLRSG